MTFFLQKCRCSTAALIVMATVFTGHVSAEPRFFEKGFKIDAEAWMEDSAIDPVSYFLFANPDKSVMWTSEEQVHKFFELFNFVIEQKYLDGVHARMVWGMKTAPTNAELYDELGMSRNAYFDRLARIRQQLEIANEELRLF